MPILYAPTDQIVAVAAADLCIDQAESRLTQGSAFESSRHELSDIQFGNSTYPLKRTLTGSYLRAKEEFLVDGLSPDFVGKGSTASEAYEDFCLQFHAGVQGLIYKRPFEMTDEDASLWTKINNVADITVFKNRTPLVVEQYGVVSHDQRSYPCKIKWDNGFTETIDLRQVLKPDFVSYRPGQPIKAIVRRNPITREIIDIPFIEMLALLPSVAEMQESGFVDQVLNGDSFPEAEWD